MEETDFSFIGGYQLQIELSRIFKIFVSFFCVWAFFVLLVFACIFLFVFVEYFCVCLLGLLFFIYLFACFQREEKGMFSLVGMEMGRTEDKHDQINMLYEKNFKLKKNNGNDKKKKRKLLANEHQRAL